MRHDLSTVRPRIHDSVTLILSDRSFTLFLYVTLTYYSILFYSVSEDKKSKLNRWKIHLHVSNWYKFVKSLSLTLIDFTSWLDERLDQETLCSFLPFRQTFTIVDWIMFGPTFFLYDSDDVVLFGYFRVLPSRSVNGNVVDVPRLLSFVTVVICLDQLQLKGVRRP